MGINWQSAAAARARVPRAPLASHAIVVATTDAAMAEADDEAKTAGNVQAVDSEQVERSTRRVLHRLARREVRRLDTFATHNLAQQETGYTENIDELLANWRK